MKIKKIRLQNFKRFDDLTIDLQKNLYKVVVLVGPNGCGKSSVFDSFERIGGRLKYGFNTDNDYLRKKANTNWDVEIEADKGIYSENKTPPKNFCYLRSSYRVEADFQVNSITKKQDLLNDELRPKRMIDIDRRVQDNYERLVSDAVKKLFSKEKNKVTAEELREELIGKLKQSMLRVFPDLILDNIGDPQSNGQFYFDKGLIANFPYKNLSGGEKGAFDILLDLLIKVQEFNDTVIAIDEPDLHMHSSLQRRLMREIYNIIPEECQLWLATHSVGFIRETCELVKENPNTIAIIDFSYKDFDNAQVLFPEKLTSNKMRQIFEIAVDDLATMITPSTIVLCEGSKQKNTIQEKKELDAKIYNRIFYDQDILFVAGDCKPTAQKAAALLLKIVKEAGSLKRIISLSDRDNLSNEQIQEYQNLAPEQKFLGRRENENYIFDDDILRKYCESNGIKFAQITSKPKDIINDDLKSIQGAIMNQCGFEGTIEDFKLELASYVTIDTSVYQEIKNCIGI
jgi:predicted ATP-binding protein involved in virulence